VSTISAAVFLVSFFALVFRQEDKHQVYNSKYSVIKKTSAMEQYNEISYPFQPGSD
jgi:hypothetical protein